MNKALFLDRDGTLVDDPGFVHKVEDFKLLQGVIEGLKILSKKFIFVIITNQSGIGRGVYTEKDMDKFNEKLVNELIKEEETKEEIEKIDEDEDEELAKKHFEELKRKGTLRS